MRYFFAASSRGRFIHRRSTRTLGPHVLAPVLAPTPHGMGAYLLRARMGHTSCPQREEA